MLPTVILLQSISMQRMFIDTLLPIYMLLPKPHTQTRHQQRHSCLHCRIVLSAAHSVRCAGYMGWSCNVCTNQTQWPYGSIKILSWQSYHSPAIHFSNSVFISNYYLKHYQECKNTKSSAYAKTVSSTFSALSKTPRLLKLQPGRYFIKSCAEVYFFTLILLVVPSEYLTI